jgi:hypothetical protein
LFIPFKEKAMVHILKSLSGAALIAALGLATVGAAAPMGSLVTLEASLAASSEVPPNSSAGIGAVEASFNKDTRILNYTVSYSGLTGPVKAGHFHGPAAAGTNAGVVIPFAGSLESPIKGTAVLSASQADQLLAGKWYVNLHTAVSAGGEIRGQVQPK